DLWHGVARLEPRELRAALSGHLIERRGIGERKQASDRGGRVQGGLPEALVELAATGARDVNDHAVEPSAAGFVLVQAQVEQVAQEAPGLRDADHVRVI